MISWTRHACMSWRYSFEKFWTQFDNMCGQLHSQTQVLIAATWAIGDLRETKIVMCTFKWRWKCASDFIHGTFRFARIIWHLRNTYAPSPCFVMSASISVLGLLPFTCWTLTTPKWPIFLVKYMNHMARDNLMGWWHTVKLLNVRKPSSCHLLSWRRSIILFTLHDSEFKWNSCSLLPTLEKKCTANIFPQA